MNAVPNYAVHDLTRLIASRIRGLMAQHGVKQADLAASINVSQSQLSKMVRGARPIDIDQLDGMCLALGQEMSSLIAEAEAILVNLDVQPNARYIFVDDGIRLQQPIDTEGWGNGSVIPSSGPTSAELEKALMEVRRAEAEAARAAAARVSGSTQDDEADIDITSEVQSAYDRAAHRGPRKADVPYAE